MSRRTSTSVCSSWEGPCVKYNNKGYHKTNNLQRSLMGICKYGHISILEFECNFVYFLYTLHVYMLLDIGQAILGVAWECRRDSWAIKDRLL